MINSRVVALAAALTTTLALSSASAQGAIRLAGSWKGDKALGDVVLNADGTGLVVFEADPELTMRLRSRIEGDRIIVSQDEPNRAEYYLAFNRYLKEPLDIAEARRLAKEARPMAWAFRLSGDGKVLSGVKRTTAFAREGTGLKIDNAFERAAEWTRLAGRVAKPEASLPDGRLAGPSSVALRTSTPGASIVYTVDGSAPLPGEAAAYRGPLAVRESLVLKAVAVKDGWLPSEPLVLSYLLPRAKPEFSLEKDGWRVTIVSAERTDEGALCRFVVENLGDETRDFYLNVGSTRLFTASGDEKTARKASVGKDADGFCASGSFIPGAPMNATVLLPAPPTAERAIAALDVNRGAFIFQDIPLPYSLEPDRAPGGDYKPSLTIGGWQVDILSLKRTDEGILAELRVVNRADETRTMVLDVGTTRAIDTNGREYPCRRVSLGSKSGTFNAVADLLPGVPLKASVLLAPPPAAEDRLEAFDMNRGQFVFRDAPIGG